MGFSSNLDLDELLRYFLSGSFFIAICAIGRPELALAIAGSLEPLSNTGLISVAHVVVLSTVALILGHTFSIIVRSLQRRLLNRALGDPKYFILPPEINPQKMNSKSKFYSNDLRRIFKEKFTTTFDRDLNEETLDAMPRVVRSYVFHKSESARAIRDRIVRVRSFCANMAISCLLAAIVCIGALPNITILILLCAALILTVKQRSLDEREAKEVYTHFIAL